MFCDVDVVQQHRGRGRCGPKWVIGITSGGGGGPSGCIRRQVVLDLERGRICVRFGQKQSDDAVERNTF